MRHLPVFLLLLAGALAACTGGSTPSTTSSTPTLAPPPTETPVSPSTPTPVATPTETPTPTPAPTAMPTATPTPPTPALPPSDAGLHVFITPDTLWADLFDKLTAREQSCIRDSVEPHDQLSQALDKPVLDWVDGPEDWEARIFQCLDPEMAQSLLFYGIIHDQEESYIPSRGELDRLKELTAATDAASVLRELACEPTAPQDTGTAVKFITGLFLCVPDLFIETSETDVNDSQRECLRDLILDLDPDLLGAMLVGNEYGENDLDAMVEFFTAWDVCMSRHDDTADTPPPTPSPATPMPAAATPVHVAPPLSDDHANVNADATPIGIGQEMAGALEFDGDVDYFMFEAEVKEIYQIDTTLGTLEYSDLDLYDSNGERFVINEHRRARAAARLDWQAVETAPYYVRVRGYGTGSYTLTVTTVADDHGNDIDTATPLEVGVAAKGRIDHDIDADYFVFVAVEGTAYRVSTELRSLRDSTLELLTTGGLLAFSDDYGDVLASRFEWVAPETGTYWIAVGGYSPGTYGVEVKALPAKK